MRMFWAGILVMWAAHSIAQDAMGKENYIKYVDLTWVSGWYTIPLAVFVLLFAFDLIHTERRKKKAKKARKAKKLAEELAAIKASTGAGPC